MLRSRSGHRGAITSLKFYETISGSADILSGSSSDNSFRKTSMAQDQRNFQFSQGKQIEKRAAKYDISTELLQLPPIIHFDTSNQNKKKKKIPTFPHFF